MALPVRPALALALLALACNSGGGTKAAGLTGDGAVPGEETGPTGPTGTRGGGGPFGGGSDPDGGGAADANPGPADAPPSTTDAGPDAPRPRDATLTPVDGVTLVDADRAFDAGDLCGGTCAMIESEYGAALVRARVCNPGSKLQCQMTAGTELGCPGCKVWVNSTVELDAVRATWANAGCQACKKLCPAIACRALTTGVCHSKMLAAQDPQDPPGRIVLPPMMTGTCLDQSDPVPF